MYYVRKAFLFLPFSSLQKPSSEAPVLPISVLCISLCMLRSAAFVLDRRPVSPIDSNGQEKVSAKAVCFRYPMCIIPCLRCEVEREKGVDVHAPSGSQSFRNGVPPDVCGMWGGKFADGTFSYIPMDVCSSLSLISSNLLLSGSMNGMDLEWCFEFRGEGGAAVPAYCTVQATYLITTQNSHHSPILEPNSKMRNCLRAMQRYTSTPLLFFEQTLWMLGNLGYSCIQPPEKFIVLKR